MAYLVAMRGRCVCSAASAPFYTDWFNLRVQTNRCIHRKLQNVNNAGKDHQKEVKRSITVLPYVFTAGRHNMRVQGKSAWLMCGNFGAEQKCRVMRKVQGAGWRRYITGLVYTGLTMGREWSC